MKQWIAVDEEGQIIGEYDEKADALRDTESTARDEPGEKFFVYRMMTVVMASVCVESREV